VRLRLLTRHVDERGSLTEILRSDWPEFRGFAQATATLNYPGVIRAWHWHEQQTDLFVVISGMVKLPLYDARPDSQSHGAIAEFFLGEDNFAALLVPAGIYHGYKTVGHSPALILNFPDRLYDRERPDEHRIAHDAPDVPYTWEIRQG
jgi:dTDP-4-dehydrorhamnose 3,5-epimerase